MATAAILNKKAILSQRWLRNASYRCLLYFTLLYYLYNNWEL